MPRYDGEHEDKSFEPIPDGLYPFEVVDANEHDTKEQLILDLTIDVGRAKPFKRKVWLTFSKSAIWVVAQFLDSVGLYDHYTKSEGHIEAELEDGECIGLSGILELKEGKGADGKMYSNIERFVPEEGYSEQPAGPDAKKSAKNSARAARIANAKAATQHVETVRKGVDKGSDVPF